MSYTQAWLESPSAIRVILVVAKVYNVITSQEEDICLSNSGYTTVDGVTFYPVLVGGLSLSEKIGYDNSISMTWGDLEVTNKNGAYDKYLDSAKYIWKNRTIKIYWGDPGWTYTFTQIDANFLKIFDGIIADCDSRNIRSFNIKLRDKLESLNAPISEAVIGTYGTWESGQQNKEQLKPIVFGEVFNCPAVLIDPASLEYMFSCSNPEGSSTVATNGQSELLIEIRDNGAPIYISTDITNYGGATVNLANSTFTLKSPPAGDITVSVQGVKKSVNLATGAALDTYNNTIANIIATIVTQFGKSSTRLSASSIDLANFQTFNTNNPVPVGVYVNGFANVLEVCQKIAGSVGASIFVSREGKLQLIKYGEPYGSSITITPDDMIFDSFQISQRIAPKATQTLNWAKNWNVQSNITTAIPAQHKKDFAKEWLEATATDNIIANLYKSETQGASKDTFLIDYTSAYQEAERLLDYFKVPRTIYSFKARPRLLSLTLGQPVILKHPRFGLENGLSGQVVGLTPDWSKGYVDVEVIV